ncbi:MAG: PorT family protein [Cytophagaceae bacterium]|jgi:hypothetical protein|nr:PorT family protein [Cytophagaceae bacterium]
MSARINRIVTRILLVLAFNCLAQKPFFGFKAGTNISKIVGLETPNKIKLGLHLGGFAYFPLFLTKFSASQEVNYTRRYFSAKRSDGSYLSGGLDYIDFPLMLNYHITDKWFVYAGVQPSLHLYFKETSVAEDSLRYGKSNVNPIDLGYLVGVGYLFANNLLVGARVNGGAISLYDSIKGPYYNMQLFVGYMLRAPHRKSHFDDKPWYIEEN